MKNRGYKINKWNNYNKYFKDLINDKNLDDEFLNEFTYKEHNNEYLNICIWNLKEKYMRGQKDFTSECWERIEGLL